jgi:hypothetical protein
MRIQLLADRPAVPRCVIPRKYGMNRPRFRNNPGTLIGSPAKLPISATFFPISSINLGMNKTLTGDPS